MDGNQPARRLPCVGLRGGRHKSYPLAQRLAARTLKQPSGCWEIQGAPTGKNGYVHLMDEPPSRKLLVAHRVAWELRHGPIPAHLRCLHKCDNPRCVNVDHLWLGTQQENIHDSIRKGRYNVFGIQKLNASQVREIRALAAAGALQKDIARRFNIARNTVSGIVLRKSWNHLDRGEVA